VAEATPRRVFVAGLTGSIGMGKTETGKLFRRLGIPVLDSDAVVHALYEPSGQAVEPIGQSFPGTVKDGRVDRAALASRLEGDEAAFQRLEAIVHPLVRKARDQFLLAAESRGDPVVILDIPLLFETGAEQSVDAVVVVSAPPEVQQQRVLARPGMTLDKMRMLNARQIPDVEKRAKADFVIETDKGLEQAFLEVRRVAAELLQRARTRKPHA
jgi:dephospho-CoA kinase